MPTFINNLNVNVTLSSAADAVKQATKAGKKVILCNLCNKVDKAKKKYQNKLPYGF